MFQKFFEDTLISRFIKRLLRSTNIPLLHFIYEDSEILEGCLYIYKNYVIECVQSGRFYINPEEALYPGDQIYPLSFLYPSIYKKIENENGEVIYRPQGNYEVGKYKVIKYYDEEDSQIHYNFHSKFMYYDSETHFHLGEYLRYIRDRKNLNLLPYYNCFSNKSINRVHLVTNSNGRTFEISKNDNYKLYAVPVKFGQKYTVAIDSDTPVQIRTMVYNDDAGCILKNVQSKDSEKEYYSDDTDDYEFLPTTCFTKPFLKYIRSATSKDLYAQEKNLYLIIQVSKDNKSALTVLEGDHTKSWNKIISNVEKYSEGYDSYKNLSLLHFNSHTSFAFSDRLIEYLLLNVIDHTEEIDDNIEYLQDLISKADKNSQFAYKGIWTPEIRSRLSSIEDEVLKQRLIRDLDGYLNKDLENILSKGVY